MDTEGVPGIPGHTDDRKALGGHWRISDMWTATTTIIGEIDIADWLETSLSIFDDAAIGRHLSIIGCTQLDITYGSPYNEMGAVITKGSSTEEWYKADGKWMRNKVYIYVLPATEVDDGGSICRMDTIVG